MKRHESLVPISRQHHGGLLTSRLLQQDAPPYKGMPTTASGKRDYALAFWQEHLQPHFALEEATVFTMATAFSEHLAKQVVKLCSEHKQLEGLMLALPEVKEENLSQKLHEIGQLLEQHIRQEERVFFEQLQQELPEAELRLLQEQVAGHLG